MPQDTRNGGNDVLMSQGIQSWMCHNQAMPHPHLKTPGAVAMMHQHLKAFKQVHHNQAIAWPADQ